MATITKVIGGEEGVYSVEIDYDSVSLRPTALRADLRSCPFDVYAELVQAEAIGTAPVGRKYAGTFLASTRTEIVVPTTSATRLQMKVYPNGKLGGFEQNITPLGAR